MKKLTLEDIIRRHKEINKNTDYLYNKSIIGKNIHDKIIITCKIHGDFKQSPHEHMKGQGCPMCAISNCSKSKTTNVNVLIEKSIEKFGDKFSYEKTIETYKNVKSECIIHCNICNIDFKTSFYKHFRNKLGDCPKCKEKKQIKIDNKKKLHKIETEEKHNKKIREKENRILYERLRKEEIALKKEELRKNKEILKLEKKNEYQYKHTKEYLRTVFLNKAVSKYGDRYDFSNIKEYVNSNTPVPVICHEKDEFGDEHGVFMIRPYSLIAGHGCPKCSKKHKYTEDELLKKFRHIHGNKYDYGDLSNKKMTDYIDIYCRTCKTWFKQRVVQHIEGHGCVLCSKSKLELNICNLFDTNNIDYEYQKRFKWLGKQSLDFYLDSIKIGIECQGSQHFVESVKYGGKDGLEDNIERDKKKKQLCKDNGVQLIYFLEEKYNSYLEPDDLYFNRKEDLLDFLLEKLAK